MNKCYAIALTLMATTAVSTVIANEKKSHRASQTRVNVSAAETKAASQVLLTLYRTNAMEIEMGKLAQDKGNSADIRDYGKMLEKDHQKSQDKVKEMADQWGIQLMDEENAMAGKEHEKMEKLKNMEGSAFDRAFAKGMAEDHRKVIATLEAARHKTKGSVVSLIDETLPVLRKHQTTAERLASAPTASSTNN